MYSSIAANIIEYFHYGDEPISILADEAYVELARQMKELLKNAEIRCFLSDTPGGADEVFELPPDAMVLLMAEPENYVKYRLFRYLDFSKGEPQLPGISSRVFIFPVSSICRIFAGDMSRSVIEKERLRRILKENRKYRITSALGTDLVFESRSWIPLDFEICTAPIESSVNGVIVVDGALFFKKIEENITLVIQGGKIQSITAASEKGKVLVAEYKNMTDETMRNVVNRQLAEIGVGFCAGALISDCFMEAETALNTCHFCFGNNVCYGGINESEFHGASVLIKNPLFEVMD